MRGEAKAGVEFGDNSHKELTEGEVTFIMKQQDLALEKLHLGDLRDSCFSGALCDLRRPLSINLPICLRLLQRVPEQREEHFQL